ncbi:MAG: exported protein of unknown function [Phycisphaerales bacterium]|nr:exported protein of unknown function [Phycisphaerales bacterium]
MRISKSVVMIGAMAGVIGLAGLARADVFISGFSSAPAGNRLLHLSDAGVMLNSGTVGTEEANAVAVGAGGTVYVALNTLGYGSIARFNGVTATYLDTISGQTSTGTAVYGIPSGIATDGIGNLYATTNQFRTLASPTRGLLRFDLKTGKYAAQSLARPVDGSDDAMDVAVGPDGHAYEILAADGVVRTDPNNLAGQTFIAAGAGGMTSPTALAFGPDGNLYVANFTSPNGVRTGSVLRFDGATGNYLDTFIPPSAGVFSDLAFNGPDLLAVVSDSNSILRYNATTGAYGGVFYNSPTFSIRRVAAGAVPEPASLGAIVLAAGGLLRRRRRHAVGTSTRLGPMDARPMAAF